MAFKPVRPQKIYRPYKNLNEGDVVAEGWFEGTTQGEFGLNYDIRQPNGDIIEVNGCGHLNYQFYNKKDEKWLIHPGDYVRITYLGEDVVQGKNSRFKGKKTHTVKVDIDEEKCLDPNRRSLPMDSAKSEPTPPVKPAEERVDSFLDSLDDDGDVDL